MTEKKQTKENVQASKKKARKRPVAQAKKYEKYVKGSNDHHKTGNKIALDKVDEMYRAYMENQTANHVAKKCGVSSHTASKYINRGDHKRKILSFKQRTANRHHQADKRAAVSLAEAEKAMLEATMGTLSVVRYALVGLTKKIKQGEDIDIDPHRIPAMLKDLNGIIRYAKGDPDAKVQIEDKYKNWTTEELTEYYFKGILPEHAKGDKNAPRYIN